MREPALFVETSTGRLSMALRAGGLVEAAYPPGVTLTRFFAEAPRRLAAAAGVEPSETETIVVGTGPGSYTGLRCGVAFAEGLAKTGKDKRLLGVPSLLAWGVRRAVRSGVSGFLVMTAEAFRGELYVRVLEVEAGRVLDTGSDEVVRKDEFPGWLDGRLEPDAEVTVFGPGGGIAGDVKGGGGAGVPEDAAGASAGDLALAVGMLGAERFGAPEAIYLRPGAPGSGRSGGR